jgi:hypothetical protein
MPPSKLQHDHGILAAAGHIDLWESKSRLGPAQQRRQHLAGLVAVVNRLFAQITSGCLSTSALSSLATASCSSGPTRMARSALIAMAVRRVSWHCATPQLTAMTVRLFPGVGGFFDLAISSNGSCSS